MPIRKNRPAVQPQHEPEVRSRSVAHVSDRRSVPAVPSRVADSLAAFGGIGGDEVILSRLKLMQGQSPEMQNPAQFPKARNGEFFHTVAADSLGGVLRVVPVWKRRSYELWGSRDHNQGLLASADENGNWDKPHHKFEIPTKTGVIRVDTRANVFMSGLLNFGTSDPANPKSKPLCAETFRLVLWLVDHPQLSPVMCIFARMAAIKTKELLTRMQMRASLGEAPHEQVFEMRSNLDKYGANSYFAPYFSNAGRLDDTDLAERLTDLAINLGRVRVVKASDETDEQEERQPPRRSYSGSDRRGY